jgi:hypothetical protein
MIHAKIDLTYDSIPYVMNAEAFVRLVNAMMKNKKEENEVPVVEEKNTETLLNKTLW